MKDKEYPYLELVYPLKGEYLFISGYDKDNDIRKYYLYNLKTRKLEDLIYDEKIGNLFAISAEIIE